MEDGTIITDQGDILNEERKYYDKLYKTRGDIDASYVESLGVVTITDEQKSFLDAPIQIAEINAAVKVLPNNKAPSTDGFPIDWYKMFWNKLKHFMFELFQEIVEEKELHLSARRGVISLLEKVGRDILMLKSWRPLTLLNADYKIFSKILAMRLQTTLDTIIHQSQTGFVKSRYISENAIKLLNLMEFCEKNAESAIVISIDFEKAFDKLEWQAIDASLEVFGVGEKFRSLVKILYEKLTSTILNNGFWSDWIYPTRGTRQGDPVSSILYTITAEILGIKLRANVNIKGIDMNGTYLLSAQYADDTWVALQPTIDNVNNFLTELDNFSKFAGLEVNYEKSTAFILGPLRDTDAQYYTMKELFWSDGPVKILGLYFHPDK